MDGTFAQINVFKIKKARHKVPHGGSVVSRHFNVCDERRKSWNVFVEVIVESKVG